MESILTKQFSVPIVPDELEQLAFTEIIRQVRLGNTPEVLDLPCGDGRRAVEMARLGARVLAADTHARADVQKRAQKAHVEDRLEFHVRQISEEPPRRAEPFDFVFCHHGIHVLPYAQAGKVLRGLLKSLRIGGKLFISVYGLNSALGEGYEDAEKPVEERFCRLAPAQADCYNLHDPLCLYTERNLVYLLIETGSGILRTFSSAYGTVKGVAVRL
jgi:SAM-dependent methyltransferase